MTLVEKLSGIDDALSEGLVLNVSMSIRNMCNTKLEVPETDGNSRIRADSEMYTVTPTLIEVSGKYSNRRKSYTEDDLRQFSHPAGHLDQWILAGHSFHAYMGENKRMVIEARYNKKEPVMGVESNTFVDAYHLMLEKLNMSHFTRR